MLTTLDTGDAEHLAYLQVLLLTIRKQYEKSSISNLTNIVSVFYALSRDFGWIWSQKVATLCLVVERNHGVYRTLMGARMQTRQQYACITAYFPHLPFIVS